MIIFWRGNKSGAGSIIERVKEERREVKKDVIFSVCS